MRNKKFTKLFSLILSLVIISTYIFVPANAAEPEYLSFYMDGFLIKTDYSAADYYAVEQDVAEGYKTEVYNNEGELVQIFELSEEEPQMGIARGTGTINRTFSSQEVVSLRGVGLYGVKHTVILNIYVYDSFKQIESVAGDMVTAADGIGVYTVSNTISSVNAPNGYPSMSVDCTATAACEGSIDVSSDTAKEAGITVGGIINAGVGYTQSAGTIVYFRKTITHNWSISL